MSATEPAPARRKRRPPEGSVEAVTPQPPQVETPEEMEARIRAQIEAELQARYGTTAPEALSADAVVPEFVDSPEDAPESVTIHFVEDGFTAFGKIWYRGETLTVAPGSEQWALMEDRAGNVWIHMDEDQQVLKWGKRFFRPGPWRGAGFDVDDPSLSDEQREQLMALASGKRMRTGSAPKPTFLASGTT